MTQVVVPRRHVVKLDDSCIVILAGALRTSQANRATQMHSYDSFLIDRNAAEAAVRLMLPTITAAMDSREAGASGFLHIVIMRPGATAATHAFEQAILYEHSLGDRARWDADYAAFARAKARIAWRTGLDGHVVAALKPHLLEPGDTLLWGSVVLHDIAVGVSGADPWYDEAFAGAVALCLHALAKKACAAMQRDRIALPAAAAALPAPA